MAIINPTFVSSSGSGVGDWTQWDAVPTFDSPGDLSLSSTTYQTWYRTTPEGIEMMGYFQATLNCGAIGGPGPAAATNFKFALPVTASARSGAAWYFPMSRQFGRPQKADAAGFNGAVVASGTHVYLTAEMPTAGRATMKVEDVLAGLSPPYAAAIRLDFCGIAYIETD